MNFKYEDITKRIIGCAMKVHSTLGNGFQEVIYQRALEIEMSLEGLKFEREKEMPVMYKGMRLEHAELIFSLKIKSWLN